jgi:hypothetical protein
MSRIMTNDFLYQVSLATADQVLHRNLAWLSPEQQNSLRASLRDAVLLSLQNAVARYERVINQDPPPLSLPEEA